MTPGRIAELLVPFLPNPSLPPGPSSSPGAPPLGESQLASISTYIDILTRWNARISLTSVRDPDQIVTRHFGESFFAAAHLFPSTPMPDPRADPLRVIDVGSGAGFPGLPLKIWAPSLHVTLIESSQKKVAFLREVIRALNLPNTSVFHGRAESYRADPSAAPGLANVVTLRAVENFTSIVSTASTLVAPRGRLALLITSPQLDSLTRLPDFTYPPPLPIPHSHHRILAIATRI